MQGEIDMLYLALRCIWANNASEVVAVKDGN